MRLSNWQIPFLLWLAVFSGLGQGRALAGEARTLALVPDPSCRSNGLVVFAEEGLGALATDKLKVVRSDQAASAGMLLQYYLLVREERNSVVVETNGRVFENVGGKLLGDGEGTSDSFSNDLPGRQNAARQSGQRLAESLSNFLHETQKTGGPGRRIMVQVTLDEELVPLRDQVIERLQTGLRTLSPRLQGSTERSIVLVLRSSGTVKDMVTSIEKALRGADKLQPAWQVQSENALIVRLGRQGR